MDAEKKVLTQLSEKNKILVRIFSERTSNVNKFSKSAERSAIARKEGNDLFLQKDHDAETHREIFRHYCKSISLAPLESEELAQAYGNRSALLLHIHKYEECIRDIDRTLKFTKSDLLIIKLLCRKVECMKKLGLPDYQSVLNTAENYGTKVDNKDNAQVDKMISKAKACSISSEQISKNQSDQETRALPPMDHPLNCISVEHNDEYGRHLVSKKDYKPGDFIFSDNLYVTVLNPTMIYTNCNYCLKICWSGVACDHCSWAIFCSEDCKEKGWDAFHDVECSVIPHILDEIVLNHTMLLSLRMLIVGIREAGGIDKLKEELKSVDECTDIRYKGFYQNGEFMSSTIQSVYSLKTRQVPKSVLDVSATFALTVLVAIVKYSQLIKNFKFDKIDDVIRNEDLIFLGSLLLKFTGINSDNCYSFNQHMCHCKRLKNPDDKDVCCGRGYCLASLASLANHSCNANATMIFSEDKKISIYAVQPIKKNSQIFITYTGFYYAKSLQDRKEKLEKYGFTCQCRACLESWPPSGILTKSVPPPTTFEKILYNNCKYMCDALKAERLNFNAKDFDDKDIKKLCKTISQIEKLPKPILLDAALGQALLEIYSRVYGWKPPIFVFGQCN